VTVLRLTVSRGGGSRFDVDVAPGARIGRGADVEIRLPDSAVAPVLARFEHDGGWWLVAVAPGIAIDGRELEVGVRQRLERGAAIGVGPYRLVAAEAPDGGAPSVERTASLARELVRELLSGPGGGAPSLVCEAGPDAGRQLRLPPPEVRIVVGRGEDAGWLILDPGLSRAHAAVIRGWEGASVIDLGSKNGTKVAGAPAPTEAPGLPLRDGDLIELGATRIRYLDPAEQYLRDLDARLAASPSALTQSAPALPPAPAAVSAAPVRRRWLPVVIAAVIAAAAIALLVLLLS